jgi:hypothetical protein
MISGSVAMSTYILPRATRDIDFVVHLQPKDVEAFANHFKEGYYCDIAAVRDAIQTQSLFNIIDYNSGFKADFVILKNEPFRQTEFSRRVRSNFDGTPIYLVSPEDLLISKLIWIQQLQSHIQMEDIKNLVAIEILDWPYINNWVKSLNLNTFNLL